MGTLRAQADHAQELCGEACENGRFESYLLEYSDGKAPHMTSEHHNLKGVENLDPLQHSIAEMTSLELSQLHTHPDHQASGSAGHIGRRPFLHGPC